MPNIWNRRTEYIGQVEWVEFALFIYVSTPDFFKGCWVSFQQILEGSFVAERFTETTLSPMILPYFLVSTI